MSQDKVIQLVTMPEGDTISPSLFALTESGRIFYMKIGNKGWAELAPPELNQSALRPYDTDETQQIQGYRSEYTSDKYATIEELTGE